ncbi:MAG TPA: PQQ-dependent dehydrogenase, methanol/ethanol family [Burkholderiales bacterium]|nr:PQQ-dependent dehydrogenase, methanol/ethanol family [Burkholderiales bacterium]
MSTRLEFLRALALGAIAAFSAAPAAVAQVTYQDLVKADSNTSEWLMYGRTYDGQRHVKLGKITPRNVNRLHPVWVFPTGGDNRGLQATPLVHKGVIYMSADQSRVFAIDARTGQVKWRFDPELSKDVERVYCCGSNNRGVALLGNLVYVGTMDARLIALDKDTGNVVWEAKVEDWEHGYSITGAPLVVKDMVLTGVAGGEFGIRGFVKAFDARTGALRWTAYTIPGPGEAGNETWPGDTWKHGGAPTWTTGAYDPDLNLVYWNTGNAAPWNCRVRKGDNQWSAATIAIDANAGTIKWGFQYTPWDCWDYDSVSTPVLLDTMVDGKRVKALVHYDKNGFFYVLDRTSGRFIYGKGLVPGINWAKGLDPVTGRPNVNPEMIAQSGGPEIAPIIPSLEGAIDWHPLSYDPKLNYVFFLSNNWAMGYKFWEEDKFEPPTKGEWFLGADYQQYLIPGEQTGGFVAFDLTNRKIAWEVRGPQPFWAGAVSTSSGLVFTGDMRGYFMAIDSKSGKVLWQFQTGSGIIGSPITYELDGVQYVAVPSGGIGGDMGFYYTEPKAGNLWVFALDGGPRREQPDTNLVTIPGSLPNVGEPGATLGGRVMPGYGFPEMPEREPMQ